MDISKPVGSEITSVDFGVLSAEEIRRLSSKQIVNPTVFDNLGHPISSGLYDLSLGAFLRNLCSTCGLDDKFCPGHQGHIELPVPVYNPLFFNQLYLFLRSSCLYCHHLKYNSLEVHRYACKLRLIQYGLLLEASVIDQFNVSDSDEAIEDNSVEGNGHIDVDAKTKASILERREKLVSEAISKAISEGTSSRVGVVTSAVVAARKKVIHEFYKKILSRPKCDNCGMYSPGFRNDGVSKIFEAVLRDKQMANNRIKGLVRPDMLKESSNNSLEVPEKNIPALKPRSGMKYVLSTEVRNILRRVFQNELVIMQKIFHSRPNVTATVSADFLFLQALVVPPNRFRLPSKVGEEVHENAQNELYSNILRTSLLIRDLTSQISNMEKGALSAEERKLIFNRLMNSFVTLQNDVNALIDSTKNQNAAAGKAPNPGIKQALEKKEGLFRKHMMGKRVNYAARSVISPDPMLETNEIGVPPVFATKLTYPEPVTSYNASELRQAVINGPDEWPGAIQVQNEDGSLISLIGMTLEQRKTVADQLMTPLGSSNVINKKVFRHLKNNDVVIMNRQPTLHKASMMGHKVRVLPGEKTLRLHYANTGAYNADFDGDEMNMHFPQNENARAEAMNLANTNSQYLTPTAGAPIRGLIQDHISAGVWLTNKDTFFDRDTYYQLIYGCLRPEDGHITGTRIQTIPPAVMKPKFLWTGKQVITTILLNSKPKGVAGVNLISKNKIKSDYWGPGSDENQVIFKDGALLCGILDKSQYGASQYGIIHSLHELYGPDIAGRVLSVLGRLLTNFNMMFALTCGMDDLRLTQQGNDWRTEILKQSVDIGRAAAVEASSLAADTTSDDPELRKRLEEILRDENKLGILDAITQSKVNGITSQVVSKCIPEGSMKKFPYNAMQAMALSGAKGSNVNVSQIMCLLGQQALEGRRVPVMVSGKTLPSFKALETDSRAGGYIKGRFYSGIRPQEYYFHCMAGREGLIDTAVKTSRSGYLQRCLTKQLEGIHVGYDNSVRDGDGALIQFLYGGDAIDTTKQSHMTQFEFCAQNYDALISKLDLTQFGKLLDTETAIQYNKKVRKHMKKQKDLPSHDQSTKYDPVLSIYNPSKYLGSVSEGFQERLEAFINANEDKFKSSKNKSGFAISERKFRALMQIKYMMSLIDPGEAVGIIAAQSIGEPSTQMTLNTFHFAGHGAANVTLGIPRMREIIMTASPHIKTPQMTLPLHKDITSSQAELFAKSVGRVSLSDFIEGVVVTETISKSSEGDSVKTYKVRINFFTKGEYEEEYDVTQVQLSHVLSDKFLHVLETQIMKEIKKQATSGLASIGKAAPKISETALSSLDEGDDADEEKGQSNTKQLVSYDGPDDDEMEEIKNLDQDVQMEVDEESEDAEEDLDDKLAAEVEKGPSLSKIAKDRQNEVISAHHLITKFNFDDLNGQWCEFDFELSGKTEKLLMVNIVEDICKKVVVREIPNIGRCLHPEPESDGSQYLTTEGVNFQAMWDHDDFVEVNRITSNDIYNVLQTYGVEAARNTIVNEVKQVFDRYAISVSSRHLDLIADMMTREGSYLAFNRQGIDNSTSAFMKMSFETTCQFLTKAVLDGERETLQSPSASIIMGKLSNIGTGTFDVLTKMTPVAN